MQPHDGNGTTRRRPGARCIGAALLVAILAPAVPPGAAPVDESGEAELRIRMPVEEDIPTDAELEARGAVVGEIVIDIQDVFDTENPREDGPFYRTVNRLHIDTRRSVIEQQILFSPGEPYRARLLEETERLLRDNRYLFDADVRPMRYSDGRVDVLVTTRDVWTLNPGFSFSRSGGENTTQVELEDHNLLGTGARLGIKYDRGVERDSTTVDYANRNLGDSWVTLVLSYTDSSDGDAQVLFVDRPFYSLDTRWAAGLLAMQEERVDPLYALGEEVQKFGVDQTHLRAYGGWSAGLRDGWTRRWTAGFVVDDRDFYDVALTDPSLPRPADRRLRYPFIGFELIEDDFSETRNHDQIGRTEDFYLGTRFSATIGWAGEALGSDRDALVFSADAHTAFGRPEDRMLLLDAGLSGRWEEDGLANAVLSGSARWYWRQSDKRLFFVTVQGDVGENLDIDNPLVLGGEEGLRGYPLRYQTGDARLLATVEQRYFTDWYPWRLVRVGGAIFFDAGRTWGDNPVGGENFGWLKDVGFGLRLGTTRSGINKMMHLDVSFPLDGGDSIDDVQISLEGKRSF